MPWYKSGSVNVTQNSNAVIGTGTAFIANSRVGDGFRGPDGGWYEVTNIASDTALAIDPPYQGATNASGSYALAPLQGYVKDSADALRALVNQFGGVLGVLGTTATQAGVRASLGLGAASVENVVPILKGGTGATTASDARTAFGLGSVAVENTVPLNKGGTGVTDGRPTFVEVGVSTASARYNIQGMYMGWNSSSQGEGHFIVNRGGGSGGFTWRSVNAANTATGPNMSYSYDGLLTVPTLSVTGAPIPIASGGTGGNNQAAARSALGVGAGQAVTFASLELVAVSPFIDFHYNNESSDYNVRLINDASNTLTCTGNFAPKAILGRQGINGAATASRINFNWAGGSLESWVDATYVGNVSLVTSDYRIKRDVETLDAKFLDRIDSYRVVTYGKKDFSVWADNGRLHQGLIAHEAQAVNPLATVGAKDGVGEDGEPIIQQLDPMALITDLMGAIKELRAEVSALKAAVTTPTAE